MASVPGWSEGAEASFCTYTVPRMRNVKILVFQQCPNQTANDIVLMSHAFAINAVRLDTLMLCVSKTDDAERDKKNCQNGEA